MITGDYPITAQAIAGQIGLTQGGDILTGAQLDQMSDAQLNQQIQTTNIFARAVPEQKLRIVNALKDKGEVVAMTGDGVNDAPALKAAQIGIAMGQRGTDVAREAAALVLLDDDFASIVQAVKLGRRIFDNLRKAMAYLLAIHVPIAGI
jgi:P-type Ca2+ transporter type 2C